MIHTVHSNTHAYTIVETLFHFPFFLIKSRRQIISLLYRQPICHSKLAQVMPTPRYSVLAQRFSRSPRYLTTRFHHLRTVGEFVFDHVLQRANGYINGFSFRFAPFPSIDRTPTSTSYLRLAQICLFFF